MIRLAALDAEDLAVMSALVQDAVFKVGDITFAHSVFAIEMNRFAGEKAQGRLAVPERRRTVIHFARVTSVRTVGIDRSKPDAVLNMLALQFSGGDAPGGTIEITCSGAAAIRLDVECIEAQLSDAGSAWEALGRPRHEN